MERQETVSPGSRLMNFFQTLERLTSQRSNGKYGTEDLQQLRYICSKILQSVTSQDTNKKKDKERIEKIHRDIILKNSSYIDSLLSVLETANDGCTVQNIVYTLHELIGKTNTGKRATTLVSHGATHILLQLLVYESHSSSPAEELLFSIHQVLSKLGPKDRKFGIKARLCQALGVTLSLLKNQSNLKLLQSVVHVLKLYAANTVNASHLGKNGAVSLLFKLLSLSGRKYPTLSKYSLDALALLVKSKSNSARAVGQGGVPHLLTMYCDWHRIDTKNRHINIRKAVLNVIKHITNLRSGRKAFMEADGVQVLYSLCQDSLECRELECLIFMASIILRKCFPRNRLPLPNLRSPVSFPLPESDFHVVDMGEGQGDENGGYESSVDNDDDVSSEEDAEAGKMGSDDDADNDDSKLPAYIRTGDDLAMYAAFFTELHEFNGILEEEASYGIDDTIIIPPTLEYSSLNTRLRSSQSANILQKRQPISNDCSSSAQMNIDQTITDSFKDLKLSELSKSLRDTKNSELKRPSSRMRSAQNGENLTPRLHIGSTVSLTKSNSCETSLDISPKSAKKPLHTKSPKAKRRGSKGKVVKEKKEKKSRSSSIGNPVISKLINEDWLSSEAPSSANGSSKDDENSEDDLFSELMDETEVHHSTGGPSRVDADTYCKLAAETRSVGRFNKIAYPDMHGSLAPPLKEAFLEKRFGTQRQKIFEDIDRLINPDKTLDRVVYDLDTIVATAGPTYTGAYSTHANNDEERVTLRNDVSDHLKFNSQFECGNLRKAIQIRPYEYDLILNPDINTNHHHQWFYFEVSNMEAGVKYRFNIVNHEKVNSQFNFGMCPVMYSVTEAMLGRPYWVRVGSEICYYKNHFVRSSQTTGGVRGKTYFTGTFSISFKHAKDVCYLAYHYPYNYTTMKYHLHEIEKNYDSSQIYFRNQELTRTLGGNSVPVLTITSHPQSYDRQGIEQLKNRPYIFLSGRVHPGESNASWVMKGTINFLMSDRPAAQTLRDMYIFKIVPMLNPDGVINGNHRCSLVAEDLNRRWMHPCPKLHPTIYHTKGLLQYLHLLNKAPLVYCDYHGHSRRKNVFLYGCSPSLSWMTNDFDNPAVVANRMEDTGYKTLPKILQNLAPAFSLANCNFVVEKSKESTARVVVWRQIGVMRSYTMESTYCGCDQGPYKGYHINTRHHDEMGRRFCEGLIKVRSRHFIRPPTLLPGAMATSVNETDSQQIPCMSGSIPAKVACRDDADEEVETEEKPDLPYCRKRPLKKRFLRVYLTVEIFRLEGAVAETSQAVSEAMDLHSNTSSSDCVGDEEEEEEEEEGTGADLF